MVDSFMVIYYGRSSVKHHPTNKSKMTGIWSLFQIPDPFLVRSWINEFSAERYTIQYIPRVVDLALNQAAKFWIPIFRPSGTICGGLFPKMCRGQICNLDTLSLLAMTTRYLLAFHLSYIPKYVFPPSPGQTGECNGDGVGVWPILKAPRAIIPRQYIIMRKHLPHNVEVMLVDAQKLQGGDCCRSG